VLYVAAEDGSGAAQVTASAAGPFALSPDGATIALVEGETLKLVKVAGGAVLSAGPAEEVAPVWMPNSKAVMFARAVSGHSGAEVWRVGADGAGSVRLGAASGMAVSADGSVVALVQGPSDTAGGAVWVSRRGGKPVAVKLSGSPTAVGVSADRMWVAMTDAGGAKPRIVTAALDGTGEKQVAGAPPGVVGQMVAYGDVEVSPDGRYLVFCAGSDDGYSRMYSIRTDGGGPVSLSVRRDDYCRGFSATGEYFYFLEGNAFQGEPTALWRVSPDGTRRFLVVDGAK
jgi:Tol biopolymer transport system component